MLRRPHWVYGGPSSSPGVLGFPGDPSPGSDRSTRDRSYSAGRVGQGVSWGGTYRRCPGVNRVPTGGSSRRLGARHRGRRDDFDTMALDLLGD